MTDRLMLAFAENEAWLSDFSRRGYEDGFRRYCGQFLPDYLAAVREKGAEGIPALADGLLDAMEAQWKRAGFWNRSVARTDLKRVLTVYLTPMLLTEQELRPLAAALRDGWNRRWPKDSYHAARYETIRGGFKLRILGFEVPERKKNEAPQDEV